MLWLLVLVPVLGAGLVWAAGYRRVLLGRFGINKVLDKRGIAAIGVMTWLRMALFLLAVVSLIFALARPQWGYHERQVITHGVDLMVAVDTSDSMMARDFAPNRLARAKELLRNLIWEAQGDRVGIVAFSGSAVVMCPLTLDYNMAATALKAVDVNTVSAEGTNIAAAIRAAKGAFEVSGANDRMLVLLTDGEQLDKPEDLDAAVEEAAKEGIRIFAIGLGTTDGSTIPTMAGPKRSSTGDIVQTSLNFTKLEEIAEKTKGEAIRAETVGAGEIAEISAALSKYRGRKQQDKTYRVYHDRYPWFVGAALLLLLADALLSGANKLKWPRRTRRIAIGLGALGVLTAGQPGVTFAYPGEGYVKSRNALHKYHAGEFDESSQLYQKAAEVDPQSNQIQFNLGAAAAKAGKVEEARESLGKVYDPENPTLTAYAQYGIATLDHRKVRKQIADKKSEWSTAAAQGTAPKEEIQQAANELKRIIEEYKQTILAQPDDMDMKANFELAKKDLQEVDELLQENQEQQQQQQPEQQQENQQEQQEQQKDGEQKEQGSGQQEQQGQQGEDDQEQGEKQQDQQPEQEKPEGQEGEQQDQQDKPEGDQQEDNQGGQQKGESESENKGEEQGKEGTPDPKGTPAPTPTPSPTPQGTPQPGDKQGQGQEPADQGEPVPVGQMSPTDVDRLLNTLPPEDQQALQLMMGAPTEEQDLEHDW
jgi:Ca-activated chloride channel family protein